MVRFGFVEAFGKIGPDGSVFAGDPSKSSTKNKRGGKCKTTTKVAAPREALTAPKYVQLSLF